MDKRIKIRHRVEEISTWEFEGSLSTVLERVQELIDKHGPDARINYDQYFYYDYDNEPTPRYELYIERYETDAEFLKRLAEQSEHDRKREEAERAELERLCKKYGVDL